MDGGAVSAAAHAHGKIEHMKHSGLTLVEILVLVALIVVVRRLFPGRESRRAARILAEQRAAASAAGDHERHPAEHRRPGERTILLCVGRLPTTTKNMASASGSYNIAPCLIPTYGLFTMPFDPTASSAYYTSVTNYNTGYSIAENASGSITLSAPYAELKKTISVTR